MKKNSRMSEASNTSSLAETELREREEQYRAIFEATGDGLVILDMDGYVAEANPAAWAMHGYSRQEFLGLHRTAFIHPDYHARLPLELQAVREGGSYHTQGVDLRKDASSFPVEVRGTTFLYSGKPHVLVVIRDITERVKAEERLREKEEQYRRIFESSSDGLIINDPTRGVVVEANPAVSQMHGYTREEFIGLHGTAFIHPDYHPVFADFLQTIMAGGTYETQAIDLRKDGTTFYVEVHGSGVLYQGRLHVLAVVRDITQRVQAEQAVFEERQRLSRELHDSVSQALYGIALGAKTARALLESDPRQVVEPLEFTIAQAERGLAEMRALIFELRPEALEREGLVQTLQKHADAVKVRHHLRVETELDEEPEVPMPIKEALYRIAQEALHNTVKHAGARTIRVSLSSSRDEVILGIDDDGKGFDTSEAFPGHIGLQSMRERATQFGGTIQIQSASGMGTRIIARLPRAHSS